MYAEWRRRVAKGKALRQVALQREEKAGMLEGTRNRLMMIIHSLKNYDTSV